MNVPFWNPAAEYKEIKPEMDAAMQDVLARGDLVLRQDVEQFEQAFAYLIGTKYAVAVASGTDALFLTLRACAIKARVLVPSYTFRATIEAVINAGATAVLYDLDGPQHWQADAWMPAHLEGKVEPWFEDKAREATELGIPIIEDACQALVAKPLTGIAACYSFYPAKILGCYGDAGAVATNDTALADELKRLRNHYKDDWSKPAYNSRMDNLQAAVLNVKMRHIHAAILRRKEIAELYDLFLTPLIKKPEPRLIYQDYIVQLDRAKDLQDYLSTRDIQTMRNHYPFPSGYPKHPQAASYEENSLRLPCNPTLSDADVHYVIDAVNAFYAH